MPRMSNVQVKNIPDDIHDALRQRATLVGVTISDYVLALIRADLQRPARTEWLRPLRALPRTTYSRDDILSRIDAARAERVDR